MSEPRTPTGKRLSAMGTVYLHRLDIIAVEAEAAAMERERLREGVKAIPSGCHSRSGLSCEEDEYGDCYLIARSDVLALLSDPEPQP